MIAVISATMRTHRLAPFYFARNVVKTPKPFVYSTNIFDSSKRFLPHKNLSTNFSTNTTDDQVAIVDYDYVFKAKDNPKILIVDVREPDEIKEDGSIPNSVNIPVGQVEEALKKSAEVFRREFRIKKPDEEKEIIFYCKIGKRSAMATNAALKLGFNKLLQELLRELERLGKPELISINGYNMKRNRIKMELYMDGYGYGAWISMGFFDSSLLAQ